MILICLHYGIPCVAVFGSALPNMDLSTYRADTVLVAGADLNQVVDCCPAVKHYFKWSRMCASTHPDVTISYFVQGKKFGQWNILWLEMSSLIVKHCPDVCDYGMKAITDVDNSLTFQQGFTVRSMLITYRWAITLATYLVFPPVPATSTVMLPRSIANQFISKLVERLGKHWHNHFNQRFNIHLSMHVLVGWHYIIPFHRVTHHLCQVCHSVS